jgi:hypothetical protein
MAARNCCLLVGGSGVAASLQDHRHPTPSPRTNTPCCWVSPLNKVVKAPQMLPACARARLLGPQSMLLCCCSGGWWAVTPGHSMPYRC